MGSENLVEGHARPGTTAMILIRSLQTDRAIARFRCAAVIMVAAACCPLPSAAQDFYAGKRMTVIVGGGVGGGYDHLARLMARFLGRHIPGNPTLIVQNMPAPVGLAAANYIFNLAPTDGTVIALMHREMLLAKLTNSTGVRFESAKLNWIGNFNSETAVTLAWHTAPHRIAKDLFDKELIVGAITGVDLESTAKIYNSLIGTKFKIVNGYNSTAQIALAIERGEVQGIADWSLSSLKTVRSDWLRDRKVTLLLQGALQNNPELADVPNALDFIRSPSDRKVLELYFTQKTAARPVIAPPGIPADRLAVLRSAFMALASDQEFLAEADRTKMDVALMSGEEVEKIVALISSAPPDVVERYIKAFAY
jgi:tripartite-type tricarboxylate transporter receptor subunit TctC